MGPWPACPWACGLVALYDYGRSNSWETWGGQSKLHRITVPIVQREVKVMIVFDVGLLDSAALHHSYFGRRICWYCFAALNHTEDAAQEVVADFRQYVDPKVFTLKRKIEQPKIFLQEFVSCIICRISYMIHPPQIS